MERGSKDAVETGEHIARGRLDGGSLATERGLRSALLAILLIGMAGTTAELFFLEHYEELWQLVPIVLLGVGLGLGIAVGFWQRRGLVRAFQLLMVLFVAAGGLGVLQHYQGNVEFELERAPSLGGGRLIWESLHGATPALAPASMAWLGLIGIAFAWGHPALHRR